ncbi:MAG: Co2+/Mg2+ efflux protein ApaG [Gammaproteobacteria bacterium]|nr:Co2+/Mg2+ efflux protein ApaG [Gammaproteobacteria bacterium]
MESNDPYNIEVSAQTAFIPERSEPEAKRYFFAYTITITNVGEKSAQLISRHWIITHGDGNTEEVQGEGVVGEQPQLQPGQAFQYTSAAILSTPVGTMHGSYQMVGDDGTQFDAEIAPFRLATQGSLH